MYCYNHNVSADTSFGLLQVFFVELKSLHCSNSVNDNQVQVLSYCKSSLLFSPVVRIEPATSR